MINMGILKFDTDDRSPKPERNQVQSLEDRIKKMIEEARSYISALMWLLSDDHKHGDFTYDAWTYRRIGLLQKYIEYLEMCLAYGEEPMEFAEFLNSSYCKNNSVYGVSGNTLSPELEKELDTLKKRLRTVLQLEPGTDCSAGPEGISVCVDMLMQRVLEIDGSAADTDKNAENPAGQSAYERLAAAVDKIHKDDDGSSSGADGGCGHSVCCM